METTYKVKQGLSIPIKGAPSQKIKGSIQSHYFYVDTTFWAHLKIKSLVKEGDLVHENDPVLIARHNPLVRFLAPFSGKVVEIVRGPKRHIISVKLEKCNLDAKAFTKAVTPSSSSNDKLAFLSEIGAYSWIVKRPLQTPPSGKRVPRAIFVRTFSKEPYAIDPEIAIQEHLDCFTYGVEFLSSLAEEKLFVATGVKSFLNTKLSSTACHVSAFEGTYPASNFSVHIEKLSPIQGPSDEVWTLESIDVINIGYALLHGHMMHNKMVFLAGEGVKEESRGYYIAPKNCRIRELVAGKLHTEVDTTILSGNPLSGSLASLDLGIASHHNGVSVLLEKEKPRFMHFLRPGLNRFSASNTYVSALQRILGQLFSFSSLVHGEERAIVDGSYYDAYMPLNIPTALLIKAILSKNFTKAVEYGLLEVAREDFLLPTFICPSKINMAEIVQDALNEYATNYV